MTDIKFDLDTQNGCGAIRIWNESPILRLQ